MKAKDNIRGRRLMARVLAAALAIMLVFTSVSVYGADSDDISDDADTSDIPEYADEAYENEDPEFFRYYTIDDSGNIILKDDDENKISRSRASSSYKHPDKYKDCIVYNCVDVSEHQGGSIDWEKVKKAGMTHTVIRAAFRGYGSKGTLVKDSYFKRNIEKAYDAGLKVGVYIYSQAVSEKEAKAEADYVMDCIKPYKSKITMPVVFDYEFSPVSSGRFTASKAKQLGKKALTNNCIAFCERVEAAGYEAMIYANYSMLTTYLNRSTLEKNYKIWLAHYNKTTSYPGEFYMWQYTSDGSVNGISGRVDMNFIYHSEIIDVEDYTGYTSTELNHRDEPVTGNVNGTLPEGTKIIITHEDDGWGKLGGDYADTDNWVSLKYVRKPSDIRKYARNADGKYVFIRYDGKTAVSRWVTYGGNVYYVNSEGTKLTGYKKVGNYYYLFGSNGARKTGTVTAGNKKYKLLSSGKAVLYTAKTTTDVNYRTGPSTKYKVKGSCSKGKSLSIIREKSGWGYTSSGCWVSLKYVKKVTKYPVKVFTPYKVKTVTDVNYRKGPGTGYKKVGAYSKGKTVTIKAVKNGWGQMNNGYWLKLSYTKKL